MSAPLNVIVDLSHHNGNVDLAQAKAAGIVGVIHKATQGTSYQDPMYKTNKAKAQAAGLLWGAYHFGVGADGVEQADHFLQVVQPGAQDLLVLDFESNAQGPTMTLEEARAFVTHINESLGDFPGMYSRNPGRDSRVRGFTSRSGIITFLVRSNLDSGWQYETKEPTWIN